MCNQSKKNLGELKFLFYFLLFQSHVMSVIAYGIKTIILMTYAIADVRPK